VKPHTGKTSARFGQTYRPPPRPKYVPAQTAEPAAQPAPATFPLRIDRAAHTMRWGSCDYAITEMKKTADGFAFVATAEGWSPMRVRIAPASGHIFIDGGEVPQLLIGWQVNGTVATAETRDVSPDDPELTKLLAGRLAKVTAG